MRMLPTLLAFLGGSLLLPTLAMAEWHWQNPLPSPNVLKSVVFTDADHGFAVGQYGTVLRTSDGGSTWIGGAVASSYLQDLIFVGDLGIAVGNGGVIIRTPDGGVTWDEVPACFG